MSHLKWFSLTTILLVLVIEAIMDAAANPNPLDEFTLNVNIKEPKAPGGSVLRSKPETVPDLSSFVRARGNCRRKPLPEVEGGAWLCASDPITYGTKCVLTCTDQHAIPEGDYQVFCTGEGWIPNPSQTENPPMCISHPCGPLSNPPFGSWECHQEKDPEGEVCTLHCVGETGTQRPTVCAASQWHPDPTWWDCPVCVDPEPPLHGYWTCQEVDNIPSYNYTVKVCTVHCDVGYTPYAQDTTICSTVDNIWTTDPHNIFCEEVPPKCEAPVQPPHGRWECDATMQSCLIACEEGFDPGHKVEIGCGLEGDWCSSDLGFACQPACEDLPGLVKDGSWSCEERRPPYVECSLTCDNGTRMIGDGIVSCGLGQVWTGEDDHCTGCSSGTQFMGRCYELVVETVLSWDDASKDCSSRGGALASIQNEDVNTFLTTLTTSNSWVGGSDVAEEGVWVWPNGHQLTYTNWYPGEPDNAHGGQDCMSLNYIKTGFWDDAGCTLTLQYICEFPISVVE